MKSLAAAVLLALGAATPAFATTTLDFESVESFAPIGDFYPGLTFGGDAIGLANDATTTFFSNAPSPVGVLTTVGPDSALNAVGGLSGAISFFYSSSEAVTGGVQVWSGLNGTGSLLASFDLAANAQTGCTDTLYCHFDSVSGSFTGIAESITFSNATNFAAFDNLTVAAVPEPSSVAMMALGLVGLAAAARRRRA